MQSDRLAPSHEVLEHTSEIGLLIRAGSLGELLAEAARALASLQMRGAATTSDPERRRIEVTAPDRAALLAEWLNELIYQAETGGWIATEFDLEEARETRASARALGFRMEPFAGPVKAATLHELRVNAVPGGLEAHVLLDV